MMLLENYLESFWCVLDTGGMQELASDSYLRSLKVRVGSLNSVDLEHSEGKGLYQNPPHLLASGMTKDVWISHELWGPWGGNISGCFDWDSTQEE